MKTTSKRTILFRQSIDRTNEQWAHFLEGYRAWLMNWDMNEFGDDWHTAEDIVSEIYLSIIREPLVINKRPRDSFRHTLICLCKHKHRELTKPWRNGLVKSLCDMLRLKRRDKDDILLDIAVGFADVVKADLMDKALDGGRSYVVFSSVDLTRWRKLQDAGEGAKIKVVAHAMGVHPTTFGKSCKKVDDHIVETVREIMKRREYEVA